MDKGGGRAGRYRTVPGALGDGPGCVLGVAVAVGIPPDPAGLAQAPIRPPPEPVMPQSVADFLIEEAEEERHQEALIAINKKER